MQMRQRKQKQPKIRHQLSQAELNVLLKILSPASSRLQEALGHLRQDEKDFYKLSDKDTLLGETYFEALNRTRSEITRLKAMNKRMSTILFKLKSQR